MAVTLASASNGATVLAGRDAELSRLVAELAAARAERTFRAVVVRAPAGVGRSALLDAFAREVAVGGAVTLAARAGRTGTEPYELWRGLLADAIERLGPVAGTEVARRLEGRLAPVFGRPAAVASLASLGAAAAETLSRLAAGAPTVLLLDDVHAADAASLGLLGLVTPSLLAPGAARGPDEAVAGGLLVLSIAEGDVPAALSELLGRIPALSLPLAPLDLEGLRAYLDRARAAERLLEATGGVPSRIEELLSPEGAVDLAARRLDRLAPADRDVLEAVAVLGLPVDADLVARVSGRKDAAGRLTRLAQARQLVAAPAAGRTLYTLARATEREALFERLSPSERNRLEAAAGEVLAATQPERAVGHFVRSGDAARAVPMALGAAQVLVGRLAADAAAQLLAEVASLPLSPSDRARIERGRADVHEARHDLRGALAAVGRARAASPRSEHPSFRARAARLCAALGAPKPAERLARKVLSTATLPEALADARVALAEALFLRGAYEAALEEAARTGALGLDPRRALTVGNVRGKALLTLGRLDEATAAFRANAEAARAAGEANEEMRALLNVGVVAHRQGDRTAALAAYRQTLAAGDGPFAAVAHANLASLLLEQGDVEEGLAQSHRALAAFARSGRAKEHAQAAQNLARVYIYMGDLARAGELAQHAAALADRVGDPYVRAGATLVGAEVLLERADEAAGPALAAAAEGFARVRNPRYHAESLLLLADFHLWGARTAPAGDALAQAKAAGALASPALSAEFHLLCAERHLALDEDEAAGQALQAAREALLEEPQVERPHRLYALLGALAERRREPTLAQAERLKSVRILDELASRLAPERRPAFYALRRRRAALEAAGRVLFEAPRPVANASPHAPSHGTAIVGRAPAIVRVNQLIERVGPTQATVLVRGESGTGKELVARALHERSPRRHVPLVALNCGAMNEELLLSELFGHEKGAFTGAIKDRKGRFELADGGTLFLDEIGDISPRAQVALLRVLQEREFERVGGTRTVKVDVRVICATNRPLEELMARGQFREDLYYRLRGVTLQLPSLRERPEDLPVISDELLRRISEERSLPRRRLSAEALRLLSRHSWPGNVRELANVLESATMLATSNVLGPEAFELFPELFDPAPRAYSPAPAAFAQPSFAAPSFAAPAPAPAVFAPPAPVAFAPPAPVAFAPPAPVAFAPPGPVSAWVPPPAPVDAAPAVDAPPAVASDAPIDFYGLLRRRDVSLKDLRHELEIACIARALDDGAGNISEAARLLKMKRSRLSQIVNSEPSLRVLCRGGADAGPDEGDDDEPSTAVGNKR